MKILYVSIIIIGIIACVVIPTCRLLMEQIDFKSK